MSVHLGVESDTSKVIIGSVILDFIFMCILYYICLWKYDNIYTLKLIK